MTCPCASVMLTCVLLNVARMLAIPLRIFLAPLALTIFLPAKSSANNSAAVGAAPTTGAAAGAAAFFGAFAGPASAAGLPPALSAAPSGLASFFGAGFFLVSSAIGLF